MLRSAEAAGEEYANWLCDVIGIEEVVTAPRSPWQHPYVEWLNCTLRRECLDHVIVLGERHLARILREFLDYYHDVRPHLSLDRNAPDTREPPGRGPVVAESVLGGLHHRYRRAA